MSDDVDFNFRLYTKLKTPHFTPLSIKEPLVVEQAVTYMQLVELHNTIKCEQEKNHPSTATTTDPSHPTSARIVKRRLNPRHMTCVRVFYFTNVHERC